MHATCHCNTTELLFWVSHIMWELMRWIHPPYTWMSRLNIFLTRVKEHHKLVLKRRNQQNTWKPDKPLTQRLLFVKGRITLILIHPACCIEYKRWCLHGISIFRYFLEFDEEDQISLLISATSKDFVNWSLWYHEMSERKLASQ